MALAMPLAKRDSDKRTCAHSGCYSSNFETIANRNYFTLPLRDLTCFISFQFVHSLCSALRSLQEEVKRAFMEQTYPLLKLSGSLFCLQNCPKHSPDSKCSLAIALATAHLSSQSITFYTGFQDQRSSRCGEGKARVRSGYQNHHRQSVSFHSGLCYGLGVVKAIQQARLLVNHRLFLFLQAYCFLSYESIFFHLIFPVF